MASVQTGRNKQDRSDVYHELGAEVCRALELLTSKITDMGRGKKFASPREYAELREARTIINSLKYPDSTEAVCMDELAWALQRIRDAYRTEARHEWTALFDRAAEMLDIDLNDSHAIPRDLDRRIRNELRILGEENSVVVSLVAAS